MKFTRMAAVQRAQGVKIGSSGKKPGKCIVECMARSFKFVAMNEGYCFCVKGALTLEDEFPTGDDVLTVLDVTPYMPKAVGK